MRCEECRDPGHIDRAIEVCEQCAPLYYAREDVALRALSWWRCGCPMDTIEWERLEDDLEDLDAAEKAAEARRNATVGALSGRSQP